MKLVSEYYPHVHSLCADRSEPRGSHRALDREVQAETTSRDFTAFNLRLVLWSLQSPINVGMLVRVAEAYGTHVLLRDSHALLDDPDRRKVVTDFSCGAFGRCQPAIMTSDAELSVLRLNSRLVATTLEDADASLETFKFQPNDIIAFGNEYDGLPKEFCNTADVRLRVPMVAKRMPKPRSVSPIDPSRTAPVARDGEPSLNVAITGAIVCFAAYCAWLQSHDDGR